MSFFDWTRWFLMQVPRRPFTGAWALDRALIEIDALRTDERLAVSGGGGAGVQGEAFP